MTTAFQSSAFQNNAFQIGGPVAPSGFGYNGPTPWEQYKETQYKLEQERSKLESIDKELALKEARSQEAARLLALKTAEQRQKKAAKLLAAEERRLLAEIDRLRMERIWLMRLIDDEEAILVILLARPLIH